MTDKRLVHIKVFGGLNYGEEDNIQQLSAQLLDEGFLTLVTDSEWDIAVLEEHEVNEMLDTLAREMKTTLDKWLLKSCKRIP